MNPIKDLITGGFSGVVDSITGVIGKFVADPNQKAAAQLEVTKLAADYQLKLLDSERDFAVQQASVVIAEAKSESWLARNWRPIIMLEFGVILGYNFIVSPMFNLTALPIPPDMWMLLKIGLGGYVFGRSGEKMVDSAAKAYAATKGPALVLDAKAA
jgi:hypothetical protein